MTFTRNNPQIIIFIDIVNQSVRLVDPSAPTFTVFEEFGLAYTV